MTKLREIATGLRFPEGPVALADGSVLVVEIEAARLTRIGPDGRKTTIVAAHRRTQRSGDRAGWQRLRLQQRRLQLARAAAGRARPGGPGEGLLGRPHRARGPGHRQDRGALRRMRRRSRSRAPTTSCSTRTAASTSPTSARRRPREMDRGAVYYAKADGSLIKPVAFPSITPNGCGLSPDGKTLYFAETESARLWAMDILEPGVVKREGWPSVNGGASPRLSRRLPALRQPGGRRRRQHLRGDADQRRHHRVQPGRQDRSAHPHAGPPDHQHLLRRAGSAGRLM